MHDFIGVDGVIERERLEQLSQRSDGPALLQLASHVGAIAANTALLAWSWGTWWSVPFFLLQGMLISFLYAPQHECDHRTAFKTRWLNLWVGRVCGFLIFIPSEFHRCSHFAHHRHTQDWEKDTEILGRGPITKPSQYLLNLSGLPSEWFRLRRLVRFSLGRVNEWYLTGQQRDLLVREARWYLAGYGAVAVSAVALASWWPLIYWIGPLICMRWTYWLEGLGEHTGLTHAPNTMLNTRTLRTNAFMRWLNWNMTYHCMHHTFPCVPFYRLPELHREVESRIGYQLPSAGYFEVHWSPLKAMLGGATELGWLWRQKQVPDMY